MTTDCVVWDWVGMVAGVGSGEEGAVETDTDERQPGVTPGTPLDQGKWGQGGGAVASGERGAGGGGDLTGGGCEEEGFV